MPELPPVEVDPELGRAIAAGWRIRANAELRASVAFAGIVEHLARHRASMDLIHLAARAVADEVRHAALCRSVAERYDPGNDVALEAVAPRSTPAHDLSVVMTCAVNETLGAAVLQASLESIAHEAPRLAVRALLADEIDHGRIGWAHAASLTGDRRAWLERALPEALEVCRATWRERIAAQPHEAPEHGLMRRADLERVVDHALEEVVRPGLRQLALLG